MSKKETKKRGFWSYFCLVAYIVCTIVLIVEASMNGSSSANQSNAVGGTLAEIFNDVKGDQTVAVTPTDLIIKNKTTTGYIGDKYQLEVECLPEDTTYKAVYYYSSNERVASVNASGVVSFINEGHATIYAINDKYPDVKDSMDVEVFSVEATSFSATIDSATLNENGVYTLYLANEYHINDYFEPVNTTNKDLSFEYDTSYLEINEEHNIIPKKYSANNVLDIVITHKELTYTLQVTIDHESVVKLEDITLTVPNNSIYVTQSINPTIKINPSNTTFKDYTLTSSDTSILNVKNNKSIVGVKEGSATLTVKSNTYENVFSSIDVTVLAQPPLEDFTISNVSVFVGKTAKVSYKKVPTYAVNPTSVTYKSLNENIAKIDSKGTVTGISAGTATIEVTVNGVTKTCQANVKPVEVVDNIDFELSILKEELNYGATYNLSEVVTVSAWTPSAPSNKSLTYELEDSSIGVIDGGKITLNKLGQHNLFVTHAASSKTHSITLNCTPYDFNAVNLNNELLESKSMIVNETLMFKIIDTEIDTSFQSYEVTSLNPDIVSVTEFNDSYEIKALDAGNATIKIKSCIENEEDFKEKTININVSHSYSNSIEYDVFDDETGKQILFENHTLDTYVTADYSISAHISSNATIYKFKYSSTNENVAKVESNGDLIITGYGSTEINIEEEYSKLSTSFTFNVYNYIQLVEDNPFTLEGNKAEQLGTDFFAITNGFSGSVKLNFTENSTYTTVTYSSSNEEVASINQDGTITPNKVGETTITIVCDDGMQKEIKIEFKLKIKRQDYIQDLSKFFYQVRKGLGHFSAFLILGIFSTLTWLLFMRKWKMFLSVPINYISGLGIAALTELIQYYIPGRSGVFSDVMLNFEGFIVSATFITAIFILIYLIKILVWFIKLIIRIFPKRKFPEVKPPKKVNKKLEKFKLD